MSRAFICYRCDKTMQPAKTSFTYMGLYFHAEVPRCPQCGQVYISEELARGKMAEVEMQLEEK
ncbi:MAG: DVU_1557 family redox protein [Oscillospiraceae bacterium]|jgi:phage FluMu protein Com